MMDMMGNLYIIAAPSGTGKTTLVKALIDSTPGITVSISHTTREKRPNEVDGEHYHFVDQAKFKEMIATHSFLEYARIFDHYYGTSKHWVEATLRKGIDVILEIDWQGHQQMKSLFPHAVGIFILPPSYADLKTRLTTRNQDRPDVIEKRLADTKEAVSHILEFDYVVINDDMINALHDLKVIIEAGQLHTYRQMKKYSMLIQQLKQSA